MRLRGLCRSRERWGDLGCLILLAAERRRTHPGETRASGPNEAAWQGRGRGGGGIVSLVLVSPLTWVSADSVSIWEQNVTFLARLAILDSVLGGCPIAMPLISFFMGPGPQGTRSFPQAHFEVLLGFACVSLAIPSFLPPPSPITVTASPQ